MDENDIKEAQQVLVDLKNSSKSAAPYDPSVEIENSLVSLLRSRIEKLQQDVTFEEHIKEAILTRLPEADFSELINILNTVQINGNQSIEKILSPFIPRVGERVPLLDPSSKEQKKNSGELVFNETSKEDLQALNELMTALRKLKEAKVVKQIENEKSPS